MVTNSYESERNILSLPGSAAAFDSHINEAGPHTSLLKIKKSRRIHINP